MTAILEINHLKKSFGSNEVLKDIHLTVNQGEVISIIGSSGSGKSTLLRSINLLEKPSGGEIIYKGENVLAKASIFLNIARIWAWFSKASTCLTI